MSTSFESSFSGLAAVVDASPVQTGVVAALCGILLHIAVLRVYEVEQFLYTLLFSLFTALLLLGQAYFLKSLDTIAVLFNTSLVAVSFATGVFGSILVYRLLFHPLRRFPGPLGAKISAFYPLSQAAKKSQFHREVQRMQQEYGDFVRTSPRELCIVRKSAVPLFLGMGSECRKSTWYAQAGADPRKASIHMTRDTKIHKNRRRAWDRGFSIKALRAYEPRMTAKVEQFVDRIATTQGAMDMTYWSMLLSFDIMGEVGLGKDFGGLVQGVEHPAIKAIHDHMEVLGIMSHVPWLLELFSHIPGATGRYEPFFTWCSRELNEKKKNWTVEEKSDDIMSWLLKSFQEKDISAPPTEEALHEDSRVLIIAGSETTATSLACIFFYLAKYPAVQTKLRQRILAVMPTARDWDNEKLKEVSYLDDVIKEVLRLKPPVITGGHREVPKHGIQVDEMFIPGGSNVCVPTQMIQTDPRYWKHSKEFIPERFGELRQEMETDETTYIPFSIGEYSCPGKNLAIITMRMTISRTLQEFFVSFGPGEDGEIFDREAKDTFTTGLPPIMIQFSKRDGA